MNKKNKIDMKGLAHLSMLYLSDEELQSFEGDMEDMIAFVSRLDSDSPGESKNEFSPLNLCREDVPLKEFSKNELLSVAPKERDGFFAVPKVVD